MYQSVLCLTTAPSQTWAVGKSVWNSGSRGNIGLRFRRVHFAKGTGI